MVKNFNDLNEKEKKSFRELYKKYFKKILTKGKDKTINPVISMNAEFYADEMITRLLNKERIGYVYFQGEIKAFMVGREYEDEGWISHIYVDDAMSEYTKKEAVLNLFNALKDDFIKDGQSKISTEALIYETLLKDLLTTLGFVPSKVYEDGAVVYENRKL